MVELGYRQGGPPGYGLRRQLIGSNGEVKGMLEGWGAEEHTVRQSHIDSRTEQRAGYSGGDIQVVYSGPQVRKRDCSATERARSTIRVWTAME
jgi:hypothetical protein